ncbi:type IV pilin N-terminal domain-containing protein [uncultured Methanoregula sp.]|uniref:type IV pilin N-terminal domain-containing protein n=1 Tax=uncultured Methanoregula sp. TaxID=1005933 RepID=UPI002AAABC3E|nr:type IV pilin N-terminal domain-containing protein [uncultured Methanoregula sp.]
MIGMLLLVSVIACGIGMIAVIFSSQTLPQQIPAVNLRFSSAENYLTIYHMGGDTIPEGKYLVRINNKDISSGQLIKSPTSSGNWAPGETVTIAQPGLSPSSYIQVIYLNGDTQQVLATNSTA